MIIMLVMDKLKILEYITEHNKEHSGFLTTEKGFKKYFSECYDEIIKTDFPSFFETFDFKQKLWHFLRNDYTQHVCKCGCKLKFRSFWYGYNEFCKPNCPSMIENQKILIKENHKNRTIEEKKKIQEKTKNTFLQKYGVERYSQLNEWKEKTIERNRKKFGKDWYTQTDEYKEYYTTHCEEKYGIGITNSFQAESVKKIINEKFYKNFLNRHPNVMMITDKSFICKCIDETCNLCTEKQYEIKKLTFSDRVCRNIETCTIKNPCGGIDSYPERELYNFISSIYHGTIIKNNRKILKGKELDIYLPELNLAFEFNGIYWHSELNKPRYYHQEKSLLCLEQGIELIHVWEDDWDYNSQAIKEFIKSKIGLSSTKIGARKCIVKEVDNSTAYNFLNDYHIQGGVKNGKNIGLFFNDELVEIMTFGKLRKNMGGEHKDGHYEIYRVCSKHDCNIQGGFSKLLKYLEDIYDPTKIITYANLEYTIGNVYKKNGFIQESISKPVYTWVVEGRRMYRSHFMKSKLEECIDNPNLTEADVMYGRGCWRCWDCGKIKFIKTYKNKEDN